MTNEELAVQAKTGDRDALARLWEQNRGLLATMFRELAGKAGARMAAMGVTWEDVEQSFFLAISLAVRLYRPERDTLFASFLSYPVKQVFYNLIGWRTERQKPFFVRTAVNVRGNFLNVCHVAFLLASGGRLCYDTDNRPMVVILTGSLPCFGWRG